MTHRPLLPFAEIAEGTLDRRKILALRQDTVRSASTGKTMQVDRVFCPDWVNVIAVHEGDLLFVRQWRFGAKAFTVELPSGIIEPGEEPLHAGLRELREETGYAPAPGCTPRVIGSVKTNPAFMANACHTVLVDDVVLSGALALDENEELEVVRIARTAVAARVRDGTLDTALGLVALHWFALYGAVDVLK